VSAEHRLRSALATQDKEMSRQPDLSVEIYVRLMELLRSSGREKEAAQAARQGLRAAKLAYGSYFPQHPFAIEMQKKSPLRPARSTPSARRPLAGRHIEVGRCRSVWLPRQHSNLHPRVNSHADGWV